MRITVAPMTSEEEAKGKAYVHCVAWKEAYRGLLSQDFLDARTLEFSEERALRAFRAGVSTLLAKDGDDVVGFADYGPSRGGDIQNAGEVYAIYLLSGYYGQGDGPQDGAQQESRGRIASDANFVEDARCGCLLHGWYCVRCNGVYLTHKSSLYEHNSRMIGAYHVNDHHHGRCA